jgi:hypothetical protein
VEVREDHTRPRIRCPQCGVMCELPPAAQKKAAARAASRPAPAAADLDHAVEDVLFRDGPAPGKAEAEQIQERPRKLRPAAPAAPAVPPPAPYPTEHSNEDDGKPYFVPGLDEVRPCPGCGKDMPRDGVVCTACGFDRRSGKKAVQVFEPVDRTWQGGWPYRVRLGLFIASQCVFLPVAILGSVVHGYAFGWFFPWLCLTAMLAFLLGTFDRVHLTRNKKGRVRLTKTWAVCFVPRPPVEVDVHEYFAVAYGQAHDVHFLEWFVFFTLLLAFVLPGLLWFYFAIHQETYEVSLTKEYGSSPFILHRGHNESRVRDIGETVRAVAHLPRV